ncbi:hypothetical protein R1flu_000372 [Riccia fluitans]|uniref:Uncharacterized protein n=1 Tax=Riccia fluitans TaxID=41844 RepID=A0ABD1Y381_9MARC
MGSSSSTRGGLQLFPPSPHGGNEENRNGDFVDRAALMDWETMPEGTMEQPVATLVTIGSRKKSSIPPTVGDDNGLPMEVAWAIPCNMKEWRDDFKLYENAK